MTIAENKDCSNCGISYNSFGEPIFPECFNYGWAGGHNALTGREISIGDFGSLVYCKWEVKKEKTPGIWKVNGNLARILYSTPFAQYVIVEYKILNSHILLTDSFGDQHKIPCCEMIYIEWI